RHQDRVSIGDLHGPRHGSLSEIQRFDLHVFAAEYVQLFDLVDPDQLGGLLSNRQAEVTAVGTDERSDRERRADPGGAGCLRITVGRSSAFLSLAKRGATCLV